MDRPAVAIATGLLLAGAAPHCARHTRVVAEPAPERAAGRAGYEFLFDPEALTFKIAEDQTFVRPQARAELAPPSYPARPLAARFGSATVGVRIVIDGQGRVSQVADSPLHASSNGPFAADFRRAVEEAVRGWSFTPGSLERTRAGIVESSATVPVYYDVRFDFEIVDGQGVATLATGP